jgi:hypothetical protein
MILTEVTLKVAVGKKYIAYAFGTTDYWFFTAVDTD